MMDQNPFLACRVNSTKLLWLLGISFAMVLLFQYFELPYGNLLSSLISTPEVSREGDNGSLAEAPSMSLLQNKFAFEDQQEMADHDEHRFDEKGSNLNNDSALKINGTSNGSSVVKLNVDVSVDAGNITNIRSSLDEAVLPGCDESVSPNSTANCCSQSMADEETVTPQSTCNENGNTLRLSGDNETNLANYSTSSASAISPMVSTLNISSLAISDPNVRAPDSPMSFNVGAPAEPDSQKIQISRSDPSPVIVEEGHEKPIPVQISMAEMKNLLLQSHSSYHSMKPRWSSNVDKELLGAKLQIINAPFVQDDPDLYPPLFQNFSMFKRSYELMEKMLKVYVYKEGQKPIVHQAVLNGIYASEGWFMKQMETNRRFVTKNARKAHLFYMPFSSRMLEETLYVANSHSHKNLIHFLEDYVHLLTEKHPYWNRTGGSDHFLVACHDWAPAETKYVMSRCMRALCNADVKEGFMFGKDVSLPETYVRMPKRPLRDVGGKPPYQRSILAFFAGNMHGYVRPILLKHWENKDPDMKIFGYLPKVKGKMDYVQYMKSSKYCICAKGYEVNSPRVVEAIFYDCVPVIISDNFVPPFFETLNWESFAVFVLEKDIPRLKDILLSIPQEQYLRMQLHVKKVQQHFLWHSRPVRFDIFHMILHSIWFNRVLHVNPR
ncbi:hypothetical protein MLD38_036625 [Melastoma candidum]|uniref:Uncharacterized protein n=1 Tax=Melastoma candidum TaxID=119954 RepID=A0ACB9LKP3_9MYRT|nr:hypothetical protein MLD38_036625 [Melastoma candidum]